MTGRFVSTLLKYLHLGLIIDAIIKKTGWWLFWASSTLIQERLYWSWLRWTQHWPFQSGGHLLGVVSWAGLTLSVAPPFVTLLHVYHPFVQFPLATVKPTIPQDLAMVVWYIGKIEVIFMIIITELQLWYRKLYKRNWYRNLDCVEFELMIDTIPVACTNWTRL